MREALSSEGRQSQNDFGRGIWIHGAGGFGQMLSRLLHACSIPVLGFLDRRGDEKQLTQDLPVRKPDTLSDVEVAERAICTP